MLESEAPHHSPRSSLEDQGGRENVKGDVLISVILSVAFYGLVFRTLAKVRMVSPGTLVEPELEYEYERVSEFCCDVFEETL
jgi:hypothetical protein